MNDENWYRTGAAARELQTSPHKLRGLARAGLIVSQVKNGYRYFSGREIGRLKLEGLPAMPANTELGEGDREDSDEHPPGGNVQPESRPSPPRSRVTQELYAEPSRQLARSKEAVIRLEHSVEAKRLRQELRELDQANAQRRAQASQAQMRQRWRDSHIQRVIDKVPSEACAATCAKVDELLESAAPGSSVTVKVDEIIETALRPIRRHEEQSRAVEDALRLRLDQSVREDALLKMAARSEVENALRNLPNHASYPEMRAAADAAVAQINADVSHRKKIDRESEIPLFGLPLGATSAEVEEARCLARAALQVLPVGASDWQFRKVLDDAIAPVVERVNRRQAEQERQRQQASRRSAIDRTVSFVSLALSRGATSEEVAQAGAKLRLALEQLPSSAGDREWEAAKESVLGPIKAAIRQRSDARFDKMLRPQAHERRGSLGRRRPS
jgi:hypothetical protein